jgi:hypothetical protein
MNKFEQASIWKKSLGKQDVHDVNEKEREFLRAEFFNFREKVKWLAGEINSSLPEFTVHDITHIDALWDTADLIKKDEYILTPAEAFVLGGAFLVHDLGLGLASFPNGIEALKRETIWKDTVASILKKAASSQTTGEEYSKLKDEAEKIATENTLRYLHAKHAETLAQISWKDHNQKDIFLIENTELREAYGGIIGLIAHSHWWSVEELEEKLPHFLGAVGNFPSDWIIDPIKLACILRIADAIQIDDRRAPSFLRTIRQPSGISAAHWNFQSKLFKPKLEHDRLVYTSKSPFSIKETDSWWICYDTLCMIDNELKEVDSLLAASNKERLKAIGVALVDDPKRLSSLIAVSGWEPIDTKIKVTNVASLVINLGGKQLYGNNIFVPLRELIQNASDAIRARRLIENERPEFGTITLRIGKDNYGKYIEVEDNGLGMSSKVLTGPFLNFGESLWGTSLMHEEIPGLEATNFRSTGQYGIGFYSVFMWGKKVKVLTKRFDKGRESTLALDFNEGVNSRPILRRTNSDEIIKDGGTRIRVWIQGDDNLKDLIVTTKERNNILSPEMVAWLCPSIDCNIAIENNGKIQKIINANDWLKIKPLDLVKRIMRPHMYEQLDEDEKNTLALLSRNMTIIKEDDEAVGRAFLYGGDITLYGAAQGIITVGGLKTGHLSSLFGIFVGRSSRASRDVGTPIITENKLMEWASDQAELLSSLSLNEEQQIECASIVRALKGNTSMLKVVYCKEGIINYQQMKEIIKSNTLKKYIVVSDTDLGKENQKKYDESEIGTDVFGAGSGIPGLIHHDYRYGRDDWDLFPYDYVQWPQIDRGWFHSRSLQGLIIQAISEVWSCQIDEILKHSFISTDEKSYSATIGISNGHPIIIKGADIIRKPRRKKINTYAKSEK